MSEDQPKEPVPTTKEPSPAVQYAKALLKRIAKMRDNFTPRNGRKRKRAGFGCRRKKSNADVCAPARLRTHPAGTKAPMIHGAIAPSGVVAADQRLP